ncbi:MAG: glycosyltransferase family 4 protein [Nitrospirae bacterium]|nr:glycosyltransferase family 4 protein [Nitrospirota bacterium]
MNLVFWQNMLSMHQSAYIRALAGMGHSVTVVAEREVVLALRALGWSAPDFGAVRVLLSPDEKTVSDLVCDGEKDTVHVIGGLRGYSLGKRAFHACKINRARMGLLSEGADPRGVRGSARRVLYNLDRIRYDRNVDFVLAMGRNGVRWFRECGWPQGRIFTSAYITELPRMENSDCCGRGSDNRFEIIFVGQLISRKGVDILLRALGRLDNKNWRLTVVGDGPQRSEYESIAQRIGVANSTQFLGALPNRQTLALIAGSDLLVLPSRFDGWGAVINEALMRGVPAICSDYCGASDLLMERWRGGVFPSEDPDTLGDALCRQLDGGRKTPEQSIRIRSWAECIEGPKAAAYFIGVLEHVYRGAVRPVPPWFEKNQGSGATS